MTRADAHNTIREVATALVSLEHRVPGMGPGIRHRIHGAALLLGQVLVTSARMSEAEAAAACARAAELAAESILVGAVPLLSGVAAEALEGAGSELLSLAHRQVIDDLRATLHAQPPPADYSTSSCRRRRP